MVLTDKAESVTLRVTVPELTLSFQSRRDGNGIVEGKTKCFVSLIAALVAEQVVLQVLSDSEQSTTGRVRRRIHAIGTDSAFDHGTWTAIVISDRALCAGEFLTIGDSDCQEQ